MSQPQAFVNKQSEDQFHKLYREYYSEEIRHLITSDKEALEVELNDLIKHDIELVDRFWDHPETVQKQLTDALRTFDTPASDQLTDAKVRIVGFDDADIDQVGGYRSTDIGTHKAIQGQVAKTTEKTPVIKKGVFECLRCGTINNVPQPDGLELEEPYQCEGCERDGPFDLLIDKCEFRDQQRIRLQQPPEEVKRGAGATIDAVVQDDLVNQVSPGDRATISGKLTIKDPQEGPKYRIDGQNVRIEDSDFDEAKIREHIDEIKAITNGDRGDPYELLQESIAPRIHGEEYEEIKLALGLQMFAANEIEFADGGRSRGRFHILILGDPGVGKSRLVEAVDELAPRSVFTSGEGVTKAGMTAAVVRDDFGEGQWSLEAGPIVEANEGICCIDEIDKANEDAVDGLHTALEKQVVTVSKASFSGLELQARTSLLAAGNPKHGRFDPFDNVPEQIDLSPTLLSRFDLMFMMVDRPNPEEDKRKIERIIRDRQDGIRFDRGDISMSEAAADPPIEPEVLTAWVAHVHEENPKPSIEDPELENRITQFVNGLRSSSETENLENHVPVTFRKVEAIMRLAEASARVRLSETVEEEDVTRATQLVLRSMRDVEYDAETGEFDADIVETGTSTAQKERIERTLEIIRSINDDGESADEERVINRLIQEGHSQSKVEVAIERLKKRGEIYEPQDGFLRSI